MVSSRFLRVKVLWGRVFKGTKWRRVFFGRVVRDTKWGNR